MNTISMNVNGRQVEAQIQPRMQLAEFLREHELLTGTHLGCEHGICGACTVLIDGEPARSCITYAVACDGAEITTIEGLDDDPLAEELRQAFKEQHALQCGFCTPGMMMTARDIVARLPSADVSRIRLELSGNLCRCTGYVGVVNAVHQVIENRSGAAASCPQTCKLGPVGARPSQEGTATVAANAIASSVSSQAAEAVPPFEEIGSSLPKPLNTFRHTVRIAAPPDAVWAQFDDVVALSRCMPGAELSAPDASGRLSGTMSVKFGPIKAVFEASARNQVFQDERRGQLVGQGYDRRTGTRVTAEIAYVLEDAQEADATLVNLDVRYGLSGALAQFARGGLVEKFADRLALEFSGNLERLLGGEPTSIPTEAEKGGFLRRYWRRFLKLLTGARS